jgi:hypothetical protein
MKVGEDIFYVYVVTPDDEHSRITTECDKYKITTIRKVENWRTIFLHMYTEWNTTKGKLVTSKSDSWMKSRVLLTNESESLFGSHHGYAKTKSAAYRNALADFRKRSNMDFTEEQKAKAVKFLKSGITRNSKKKEPGGKNVSYIVRDV